MPFSSEKFEYTLGHARRYAQFTTQIRELEPN